jgi:hypothetical protein
VEHDSSESAAVSGWFKWDEGGLITYRSLIYVISVTVVMDEHGELAGGATYICAYNIAWM